MVESAAVLRGVEMAPIAAMVATGCISETLGLISLFLYANNGCWMVIKAGGVD